MERRATIRFVLDGHELSLRAFSASLVDFLALLDEVDQGIGRGKRGVEWIVTGIKRESPACITVQGRPKSKRVSPNQAQNVARIVARGLLEMSEGPTRPAFFGEKAITIAQRLSNRHARKLDIVKMEIDDEKHQSINLTEAISSHAMQLRAVEYEEIGEVRGHLEILSIHDGYQFCIFDSLHGQKITCEGDEATIRVLSSNLGRRVVVRGTVRSDRNGLPRWVFVNDVDSVEVLKRPEELPQFEDIVGLMRGEGVSLEAFCDFVRGEGHGGEA